MKAKNLIYTGLIAIALVFSSCNKDKTSEIDPNEKDFPEILAKFEKFDDLKNAGKYIELQKYFTNSADYEFLAGSTENKPDYNSKLNLTNIKVESSSQNNLVLKADAENEFYTAPRESYLLDWKFYLSKNNGAWTIDELRQSNSRVKDLENKLN